MRINVAQAFSPVPSGRFLSDGPDSGERFRNEFLLPALLRGENIELEIDGTEGYGSSFLEEAFGGLVRVAKLNPQDLKNRIVVISSDPDFEIYKDLIAHFIQDAGVQ